MDYGRCLSSREKKVESGLLMRFEQRKSNGFGITQRFDENSYSSGTRKQRQPLLPSPLPCPQTPASSSPTVASSSFFLSFLLYYLCPNLSGREKFLTRKSIFNLLLLLFPLLLHVDADATDAEAVALASSLLPKFVQLSGHKIPASSKYRSSAAATYL